MMPGVNRVSQFATHQRGSFLLEAMMAVLIIAFGVLGLIGLQARAMQNVDDSQFRSEAVHIAQSLIGQMWVWDQTTLSANFSTGSGAGTPYDEFKKYVQARLPGASGSAPTVTVTPSIPPTPGTLVTVTIFWKPPSDQASNPYHQYVTTAIIGEN
jgi:type IV pilus assembly protein PilV